MRRSRANLNWAHGLGVQDGRPVAQRRVLFTGPAQKMGYDNSLNILKYLPGVGLVTELSTCVLPGLYRQSRRRSSSAWWCCWPVCVRWRRRSARSYIIDPADALAFRTLLAGFTGDGWATPYFRSAQARAHLHSRPRTVAARRRGCLYRKPYPGLSSDRIG